MKFLPIILTISLGTALPIAEDSAQDDNHDAGDDVAVVTTPVPGTPDSPTATSFHDLDDKLSGLFLGGGKFDDDDDGDCDDLVEGSAAACPDVIFVFARGSVEKTNMGTTVGRLMEASLKAQYGTNIWVQGVGGPYLATLAANYLPAGTTQAAIAEAQRMFVMAQAKCPTSSVVAAGYSQGTAVMAGALAALDAITQDQVKGCVLYGYTHNKQNGGVIPGFPVAKTDIYCAPGDAVCDGVLAVTAAHFSYSVEAKVNGPRFLVDHL